ncbi:hypothetical protein BOTBODRAFT_64551 [Botryobasidium botryosum FD-172 SS1]|uniref:CBM1 domain-containing protein n=1 Tax=Botryobasidium botryosum (strain FD-172 SS1) TaxID=930990 RepID=A0A067MYX7_BOTB1|nr:hypothetical protein BOTBODRAFT_64551 [Botryobasidium botryosum FD-172 SS1]
MRSAVLVILALSAGLVAAVPTEPVAAAAHPETCGGFLGTLCPAGYTCKIDDMDGALSDGTGICVPGVDGSTDFFDLGFKTGPNSRRATLPYAALRHIDHIDATYS